MLEVVVNDALEGVDIITQYRRFYAMMLANPALHCAFVSALELLEDKSEADTLAQAPGAEEPGLST